jgi:hypothetical protein
MFVNQARRANKANVCVGPGRVTISCTTAVRQMMAAEIPSIVALAQPAKRAMRISVDACLKLVRLWVKTAVRLMTVAERRLTAAVAQPTRFVRTTRADVSHTRVHHSAIIVVRSTMAAERRSTVVAVPVIKLVPQTSVERHARRRRVPPKAKTAARSAMVVVVHSIVARVRVRKRARPISANVRRRRVSPKAKTAVRSAMVAVVRSIVAVAALVRHVPLANVSRQRSLIQSAKVSKAYSRISRIQIRSSVMKVPVWP